MKSIIHLIAAARPNFMKIAPLYHALQGKDWADTHIVHTGQHYDANMSDTFFHDLGLPKPHIHLGVGSGSHAEQTARVMMAYEKVVMDARPDLVVVVGDVNSTIACTLAVSKINYQTAEHRPNTYKTRPVIAHLEAGLRSFDRTMPEEVNRLATDVLADILWTPSPDADANLKSEGIAEEKIVRVGNIMIDSLEMMRSKIEQQSTYKELSISAKSYAVVTLHRPANVDDPAKLEALCKALTHVSEKLDLVFPVHPRTLKQLESTGLIDLLAGNEHIHLLEPLSYLRFMHFVFNSRLVITDSGGIQEETTYLGIPCLTLRPNTERPITIEQGTNQLCKVEDVVRQMEDILSGDFDQSRKPDLWDGHTADRIVDSIRNILQPTHP